MTCMTCMSCFVRGHRDHAPALASLGNRQALVQISMPCHFSTFYWIIIVQPDIEQTVYKWEEEKPNAGDEGYDHTPCFSMTIRPAFHPDLNRSLN
jgi:hypothetical protein